MGCSPAYIAPEEMQCESNPNNSSTYRVLYKQERLRRDTGCQKAESVSAANVSKHVAMYNVNYLITLFKEQSDLFHTAFSAL